MRLAPRAAGGIRWRKWTEMNGANTGMINKAQIGDASTGMINAAHIDDANYSLIAAGSMDDGWDDARARTQRRNSPQQVDG